MSLSPINKNIEIIPHYKKVNNQRIISKYSNIKYKVINTYMCKQKKSMVNYIRLRYLNNKDLVNKYNVKKCGFLIYIVKYFNTTGEKYRTTINSLIDKCYIIAFSFYLLFSIFMTY